MLLYSVTLYVTVWFLLHNVSYFKHSHSKLKIIINVLVYFLDELSL